VVRPLPRRRPRLRGRRHPTARSRRWPSRRRPGRSPPSNRARAGREGDQSPRRSSANRRASQARGRVARFTGSCGSANFNSHAQIVPEFAGGAQALRSQTADLSADEDVPDWLSAGAAWEIESHRESIATRPREMARSTRLPHADKLCERSGPRKRPPRSRWTSSTSPRCAHRQRPGDLVGPLRLAVRI